MNAPKYIGSAWRARFLRAPKVALKLADLPGFVPLGKLATARLGLKTGNDAFFFLSRRPDNGAKEKQLVRRHGTIAVKGMNNWVGDVSSRDVRPAVLNPHALFERDGSRVFTIPRNTETLYLLPESGRLRADIGTYIRLGENVGVPKGKLVKSNGGGDAWYRQVRAIVDSPWALPYNSAYDYGAWDNPSGAVLNGRFVGVDPMDNVDSDLLGAALNSTFAVIGRLLEGVATGVEGAFDVGPPAVRRIMLPDVRRLSKSGHDAVQRALDDIRRANEMPPAPSRSVDVPRHRLRLDLALLYGVGLTKGEAMALLGQMYESYARWRGDVEDVEKQMRENRKQMSRTGRSRAVSPIVRTAQRVWEELQHTAPAVPATLLTAADKLESVNVPRGFSVSDNLPLLEPGLIVGRDGRRVDVGTFERVRYAAMLAELGFESQLLIPTDSAKAIAIVDHVCLLGEQLRAEARRLILAHVSDSVTVEAVTQAVEGHWHRRCRDAGMASPQDEHHEAPLVPTLRSPVAADPAREG